MDEPITVWPRFNQKVAALFEKYAGHEDEVQASLTDIFRQMKAGKIKDAKPYNPWDGSEYIPLIDKHIVVFTREIRYEGNRQIEHFHLFTVQEEADPSA